MDVRLIFTLSEQGKFISVAKSGGTGAPSQEAYDQFNVDQVE